MKQLSLKVIHKGASCETCPHLQLTHTKGSTYFCEEGYSMDADMESAEYCPDFPISQKEES
jgi:hypothetical protein